MAISEIKGQGWRAIPIQWRKASEHYSRAKVGLKFAEIFQNLFDPDCSLNNKNIPTEIWMGHCWSGLRKILRTCPKNAENDIQLFIRLFLLVSDFFLFLCLCACLVQTLYNIITCWHSSYITSLPLPVSAVQLCLEIIYNILILPKFIYPTFKRIRSVSRYDSVNQDIK